MAIATTASVPDRGKIAALIILLCLLQGCTWTSHSPWLFETADTWCADCASARIFLPGDTMGVEFVKGSCGVRMYLNLMVCPVDSPSFEYEIDGVVYRGKAAVFEGGQRLLVCDHDMIIIIKALQSLRSVRIRLGMYNEKIEAANFPELF